MPKRRSLFFLGITALIFSRALFFFFNDPEGPNLLIVMVAAAVVYLVSLGTYALCASTSASKRFWLAVLTQITLIAVLYVLGRTF